MKNTTSPQTRSRTAAQKSVTWAEEAEVVPNLAGDEQERIQGAFNSELGAPARSNDDDRPKRLPACCFQCRKCNAIVGDTSDWVTSNKKAKTVSLQRAREVRIQDKLHMSNSGEDYGSTYSKLACKACGTELGKMYRNTSPEFDLARNAYTFDAEKITCYVLGSNSEPVVSKDALSKDSCDIAQGTGINIKEMDSQIGNLYDAVNDLSVKYLRFQDEHVKMENVFLVWEQRISQIEQTLEHIQYARGSGPVPRADVDIPRPSVTPPRHDSGQNMVSPGERRLRFRESYDGEFQQQRKRAQHTWNMPT